MPDDSRARPFLAAHPDPRRHRFHRPAPGAATPSTAATRSRCSTAGARRLRPPSPTVEKLQGDRAGRPAVVGGPRLGRVIDNPTTLPGAGCAIGAAACRAREALHLRLHALRLRGPEPAGDGKSPLYASRTTLTPRRGPCEAWAASSTGRSRRCRSRRRSRHSRGARDRAARADRRPGRPHRPLHLLAGARAARRRGARARRRRRPGAGDRRARPLRSGRSAWPSSAPTGVFNATGPAEPLTIGAMLETIRPPCRRRPPHLGARAVPRGEGGGALVRPARLGARRRRSRRLDARRHRARAGAGLRSGPWPTPCATRWPGSTPARAEAHGASAPASRPTVKRPCSTPGGRVSPGPPPGGASAGARP